MRYLLLVATIMVSTARADVLELRDAGRLRGDIDGKASSDEVITVQSPSGIRVTLERALVKKQIVQSPELREYERIRPRHADTVDGQWALAEWCREQRLNDCRRVHLERVVDLEPDHARASRALIDLRRKETWAATEETMAKRGYLPYKGDWKYLQEIELIERKVAQQRGQGEWKGTLHRWGDWLGTDKDREAREAIQQINDPLAVSALTEALASEPRDQVRLLYVDALGRIGSSAARESLAVWSLKDPVAEIGLTCLDRLRELNDQNGVVYFVGKLQSKLNPDVNRAAAALGHLGNPSAIGPLIDALVTTHEYVIDPRPAGQMTTRFPTGGGGGGGLSMGGSAKKVRRTHANRDVLNALVELSGGQNFGFDAARWKAWHVAQSHQATFDARRGP